ncbi:PP2C family serine/threonine-protein phosphatase [Roseateles sp.]|uniref:PP2C family serine/threonine-protein phosphatase n=1 Tax=Roseateles sp. TaxID=1971397 RepID=UPI002F40CD71
MNWRVVNASDVGTSHIAAGRGCEDSSWASVDRTSAGLEVLSMFVADGAGSALRGGEGAELAVQAAASFMAGALAHAEFGINDALAVELVVAVRSHIYAAAESTGLTARDYACTFLGIISAPGGTLALQIGDGGIVLDVGKGLEVPIVPMAGEYANMTHFVTDEDAVKVLVTKAFTEPVIRAGAFSDGLQRLALNMATNTAHEPFFSPFFRVLSTAPFDQEDELQKALQRFLSSPAVNERTDDDKTLVLAVQQA